MPTTVSFTLPLDDHDRAIAAVLAAEPVNAEEPKPKAEEPKPKAEETKPEPKPRRTRKKAAPKPEPEPEAPKGETEGMTPEEFQEVDAGAEASAPAADTPEVSIDDALKIATSLMNQSSDGPAKVKAILKKVGAARVSGMTPDQASAFAAEAKGLLDDA